MYCESNFKKHINCLQFRVIFILYILCFPCILGDLYNSSDPLHILTNENFDDVVSNTDTAWLIQFYNSWCGHCMVFAPTFKNLAHSILGWAHTIKVGVVDCADEPNVPLCRDFDIRSYPSMKLFGIPLKKGQSGRSIKYRLVESIEDEIINFVVDNQIAKNGSDSWKNLLFYENSAKLIMKEAPEKAKSAVMIVEKANSTEGRKVAMDFGNHKEVFIRTMKSSSIFGKLSNDSLPMLIFVDRNEKVSYFKKPNFKRGNITQFISDELKLKPINLKEYFPKNKESVATKTEIISEEVVGAGDGQPDVPVDTQLQISGDKSDKKNDPLIVYMVDIESAISYALRHEVALHKEITGDALIALNDFLSVLYKYAPVRPAVKSYLNKLLDLLGRTVKISEEDLSTGMRDIESKESFLPNKTEWIGCKGSEQHFRGFTCGLWTTFHAMTVNAFLMHQHETNFEPNIVLKGIHGFVKYFFSCKYCSEHFQEMYKADGAEAPSVLKSDSILWLWRAHNKVNARISGEASEDPGHPKVQFPTNEQCPSCVGILKGNVFSYLVSIYKESSLSQEGVEEYNNEFLLRPVNNKQSKVFGAITTSDKRREKFIQTNLPVENISSGDSSGVYRISSWGFTNMDINLCLMLYVSCSIMIICVYLFMVYRKKIRRKKFSDFYKYA